MPFKLSIISPSTGEIFTSTFDAFTQNIVPTTRLPTSHPFLALWKEHLAELTSTQPGPYDTVIDAFVSLAEGSPTWQEKEGMTESKITAKMNEMRDLLSQHPPDVIVISGVADVYSFHSRRPSFWPFICICEEFVNLWVDADADKRSDESAENRLSEKLALTALLKTSFDHEIAHWLFTLKVGCSPGAAENILKPAFPKWWHTEEAGNFVEFRSRGGILSYATGSKHALLHTGTALTDIQRLPLSYLWVYSNDHSTRGASLWFTPSEEEDLEKEEVASDIYFPYEDDTESPPESVNRPVLSHHERWNRGQEIVEEILESWNHE